MSYRKNGTRAEKVIARATLSSRNTTSPQCTVHTMNGPRTSADSLTAAEGHRAAVAAARPRIRREAMATEVDASRRAAPQANAAADTRLQP
jgi:hypothetical protein